LGLISMNWFNNLFAKGPATGEWKGYYEQYGESFSIELSLRHRGTKVSGRMIDLDAKRSQPLRKLLIESKMTAEQIEQFIEDVKSQFPDSPNGEIEYHSILPSNSLIAGEIERSSISFTKRYEGYQEIEYRLNGLSLCQLAQCEIVYYNGEISDDFRVISGSWVIPVPNEPGVEVTGKFQLERGIAG
jgi:hypothetical protein